MADVIYDDLWLCTVCTCLVANGEYDDGTDAAEVASDAMVAKWGTDTPFICLDGSPDEDDSCEQEFSRSECDGCGDCLHGYRHRAVVIR